MAKREKSDPRPCLHDTARWLQIGVEHQLRCCRCQNIQDREFAAQQRHDLGVVLFRNRDLGSYAPFDPKGWLA
jgi:hypothetical protein